MNNVIAVVNTKGGVGKSTLACNLAVAGANDGLNVLLIDADIQGSSIAFRSLREKDDITAVSITTPTIHKDIVKFSNYDLIIIDAGGRDSAVSRSAIMAASYGLLIVPVLPGAYDIWATEDTFKLLREARAYTDIKAYSLLNQLLPNPRVNIVKEVKETLQEVTNDYEVLMMNSALYARVDFKESISRGQGVIEYKPKEKAANEIRQLYQEIKEILSQSEGEK